MAKKGEAQVLTKINALLGRHSRDLDKLVSQVDLLVDKFGDEVYPHLIFTTAHLEFTKRTAKKHWKAIVDHWDHMGKSLNRELDFRVALLDYFIHFNKRIKNPKIIEIKIFQKTQEETFIDELTQLYNYRYFVRSLDVEIIRSNRYNASLSLVMFDVDDFKLYNDTNGHLAGNKALKKLAQVIGKSVRDVDILVRYGGEEFALLLPETSKEGAFVIAERIRRSVARSKFPRGEQQPLKRFSVSGGVATLNVDASKGPELIKKADQALYRAKSRGKNQIALYEEERRDSDRVGVAIVGRLQVASDQGDIFEVQNVSESGFLFHFYKSIPLGSLLHLSLQLPGRKTPIPCKAKVKRVEEVKKNKVYEIGVRLVQIKKRDEKAYKRLVHALIQKKKKA
ncbi:MAG: diguanylate cyclase [bacterium]|nr:diguanylate cyclase [bacterium]